MLCLTAERTKIQQRTALKMGGEKKGWTLLGQSLKVLVDFIICEFFDPLT